MNETIDKQDFVESVPHSESVDDSVPVDVSGGDFPLNVTGSDVSTGNTVAEVATSYIQKPLLWESDISEYDTTDGLLLLILIFVMLNTALNVFRK